MSYSLRHPASFFSRVAHTLVLGGGPPVWFHCSICPSASVNIAPRSFLAAALRSSGIVFGIDQPQISIQVRTPLLIGPSGNRAMPTLPTTVDFSGLLKVPRKVVSATVKAESPAWNIALASSRE